MLRGHRLVQQSEVPGKLDYTVRSHVFLNNMHPAACTLEEPCTCLIIYQNLEPSPAWENSKTFSINDFQNILLHPRAGIHPLQNLEKKQKMGEWLLWPLGVHAALPESFSSP